MGRTREGGNEEHPNVGDGAITLQRFRLRSDAPPVVRRIAPTLLPVSCCLYLNCHTGLCFKVEGRILLSCGRKTIQEIADEVFGEDADVRIRFGEIPKRPLVKGEGLQ